MKLAQQCRGVGPEALHIVSRHQGDGADVEASRTRTRNFKGAIRGIGFCRKTEWELFVFVCKRADRNGLPVLCILAPGERDLDLCAGSAAEIDAACVLFAADQSEA